METKWREIIGIGLIGLLAIQLLMMIFIGGIIGRWVNSLNYTAAIAKRKPNGKLNMSREKIKAGVWGVKRENENMSIMQGKRKINRGWTQKTHPRDKWIGFWC